MYINKDALNLTNSVTSMVDTEFGRMHIERVEVGKLKLITGKVIATDPILMYDDQSYSRKVSPGTYTVYTYNGKVENRKNQTVLAEIKFSDKTPVEWEMALFEGENSKGFANDEFMGYEVENGLGCFMDEYVMEILDLMDKEELDKYEKNIRYQVKESQLSVADILIDEKTGCNILVFPSGWNKGVFPTYYGLDEKGNVARLVTDFMVIEI